MGKWERGDEDTERKYWTIKVLYINSLFRLMSDYIYIKKNHFVVVITVLLNLYEIM